MGGSVGPSAETWTFLGPVRHRRIAVVRTLSPNWRDSPDTLSGNLGAVQPRQLTKSPSRGCMGASSIDVRSRRRLRAPRSAAWIATILALRRFRFEQLWIRKMDAYAALLEALIDINSYSHAAVHELQSHYEMRETIKSQLSEKASRGHETIPWRMESRQNGGGVSVLYAYLSGYTKSTRDLCFLRE